jgi:uncharacterized protein (UPF0335 family)
MTIPNTQLISIIQRIERLHEEAKIIQQDTKEVYAEAKATGLDTVVLKRLVKARRAAESKKAAERAALFKTYATEVGQPELPGLFT